MTVRGGQIAGSTAGGASDWDAVRRSAEIQFAPLPPPAATAPPQIPSWLDALGRALEAIFAPLGRLLGLSWPVFQYVLWGAGAVLLLFILWRLLGPVVARGRAGGAAQEWHPGQEAARDLLREADALAGEGRFGEAAHLLLRRSVGQIERARPDWLHPASTAREIAVLPGLPLAGRRAFAILAERVERAVFALRELDAGDWAAARDAYAAFAEVELGGAPRAGEAA